MATFLYRVGRWAFRRRRLVVLSWIAVLAVVGVVGSQSSGAASTSISLPGTEAQKAFDLLEDRFPAANAENAGARVVLRAPGGDDLTSPAHRADVEGALNRLRASSEEVASVSDPFATKTVSRDGATAYTQITYKALPSDLTDDDHDGLTKALEDARESGLTVEASGTALPPATEGSSAEAIGIALAAVVLLITFGSLVAAGLPLLTALLGVGITVMAITALSEPLNLNSNTSALAMMLGIAVGIDYALFIVSRYRSERAEGRTAQEAASRANGTAGSAVVFAGLTVVIALAGLAVVNMPLLTVMGLAAAGAVALAVAIAVTLVPAMLGFAPERVLGRAAKKDSAPSTTKESDSVKVPAAQRWARFVLRRPLAVLLLGVVGLGVIALPATKLELGLPGDGSQPTSTTQRKAYDMLAESFGPGFNGTLIVTVDAKDPDAANKAAAALGDRIKTLRNVTAVAPAVYNERGDTAILNVVPGSGPEAPETKVLVHDIRDAAGEVTEETGARGMVTGATAMSIDVSDKFRAAILPYLALVVGLAFLVLILVFRSILVPLKAALGFLLSVLASLGALVAVFQWGWFGSLLGVEQTGPIMSLMPILMVGIVFGLAMDYQVFLVTRIREAHVHGEEPRQAIESGLRHSGRVVAAAAVIMIAVFSGFIGAHEAMIKMIGFGLAIAVLFDAFVVRMTLVPAALALLGHRAWTLPGWIDRILPHVDVEGEKLIAPAPATAPAAPETVYAGALTGTAHSVSDDRP
ncbi:MMPL family transporter [Streptomyces sp. NPDC051569]|uniref:MMPL family transporter n=1 Tax=Streptomyces sp. NPDC051569 TaxID=3365661 RepID=UPI0037B44D23